MTEREKVKLLFGPYKPPRLKKGERAFCLYRDDLVVVTGWSDARLPWPTCYVLDRGGPGKGLLVDDELARAAQHESVLALCYWWGISRSSAERWRRAFGIGRMDSEGSRRLILGVVQQGLVTRYGGPPPRGRRKGRPIAGVVPAGDLGLLWTPDEIALVGVLPDDEVAQKIGRSIHSVRGMRKRLGRPNPRHPEGHRWYRPWTPDDYELLRTLPPQEVTARTGHPIRSVYQMRVQLGLSGPRGTNSYTR